MSSIVGTAYAKAEGKTEKEMKAILYGWCVKCKRILGRKKGRQIQVSFLPSFIHKYILQQTTTKHLLSARSRAGRWECKDK